MQLADHKFQGKENMQVEKTGAAWNSILYSVHVCMCETEVLHL